MKPIQITAVSEKVVEKKRLWPSGYLVTSERIGVDQYGKQWHLFHTWEVRDDAAVEVGDDVPVSESQ